MLVIKINYSTEGLSKATNYYLSLQKKEVPLLKNKNCETKVSDSESEKKASSIIALA